MRTAKALARLSGCVGSPEPSLVCYVMSTIILRTAQIVKFLNRLGEISSHSTGFLPCLHRFKESLCEASRAKDLSLKISLTRSSVQICSMAVLQTNSERHYACAKGVLSLHPLGDMNELLASTTALLPI